MNVSPRTCPQCQRPLDGSTAQGLCPACLLASAMEPPPSVSIPELEDLGRAFPNLIIEELIGTGGMGRVYKARQPHLNRTVALKVLTPERAGDPEWLERFNREARALARLNHPHIVQVHDFGEAPMPHLLMEYVEGVNLRQAMQSGALTPQEALAIVPKLCDALQYAHENGVLHRDIKPENILIDTQGRVKLVDFGLAKLREESANFTLTQSGAKLGTLAYMAPEQVEKPAEVDHRADIYSLGVVLYEMLTGELPLGRFPTPSEASGVDPRLDGVVLRTLEKRREKRFSDAAEMKSGLENASSADVPAAMLPRWEGIGYEYKSRARIGSWPLIHIAFSKDAQTGKATRAKGIIAIGMHAKGVIALGIFAYGLFAWGVVSIGLLAMGVVCAGLLSSGVVAVGLTAAHGVFVTAPVALGVVPAGYIAAGVKAAGVHVAGVVGEIDPLAAKIGDQWLSPVMKWNSIINAVAISLFMLLGAFGSWKARQSWQYISLFLCLSLIGPINYYATSNTTRSNNFGQRLRWQQEEKEAGKRNALRSEEQKVWQDALPWINQAKRTDSVAEKDKGFARILEAVRSPDAAEILRGLHAVNMTHEVQTDRTALRDAIRPHLEHPDIRVKKRAISALLCTNYEPADVERILALVPGCDDRLLSTLGFALGTLGNRDYTGKYAAPMFSLLERGVKVEGTKDADGELHDSRDTFNPLWGGKFSPEIEARIIEWSQLDDKSGGMGASNSSVAYNAFYYALSTQANKSSASVKRILELAQHPDATNIAGRCLWGLNGTVPDAKNQATVAAFMIEHLRQREGFSLWRDGLKLIRQYASRQHLPALKSLTERPALSKDAKDALMKIIADIESKP